MSLAAPVIDADRLWATIRDTSRFGATEEGGLKRLALSDEDRQVRDWLAAACRELGGDLQLDDCGNMFARFAGESDDTAPIAMGSHLDTQPTGGKLDGVLGVLGGLEVIRTLRQSGRRTRAPLMVVNWTNEEGARFAPAMLCSGVYGGAFERTYAHEVRDRTGTRFLDALDAIGYRGAHPTGSIRIGAMLELHIEQGPVLEAERTEIGVVTGVQGMRWYETRVFGQEAHTGTTPMNLRRDALAASARMIEAIESLGVASSGGVASVGLIENRPNSRNTVPGEVFFTIDLRHPDEAVLGRMERQCSTEIERIAKERRLRVELRRIWNCPAVNFDPRLIECVRRAARSAGLSHRDMTSGAGHDSVYVSRVAPTAMIFIPSEAGISHNAAEASTPEQCAAGCQVLLNAVLGYDAHLASGN